MVLSPVTTNPAHIGRSRDLSRSNEKTSAFSELLQNNLNETEVSARPVLRTEKRTEQRPEKRPEAETEKGKRQQHVRDHTEHSSSSWKKVNVKSEKADADPQMSSQVQGVMQDGMPSQIPVQIVIQMPVQMQVQMPAQSQEQGVWMGKDDLLNRQKTVSISTEMQPAEMEHELITIEESDVIPQIVEPNSEMQSVLPQTLVRKETALTSTGSGGHDAAEPTTGSSDEGPLMQVQIPTAELAPNQESGTVFKVAEVIHESVLKKEAAMEEEQEQPTLPQQVQVPANIEHKVKKDDIDGFTVAGAPANPSHFVQRTIAGNDTANDIPPAGREILSQIIDKAKVILTPDKSEMILELKPDSLGKLSLKVVTESGMVMAKFVADSQQVRQVLETNMQLLKEALQDQGLNVQGFSVSVRQDPGQSKHDDSTSEQQHENRKMVSSVQRNSALQSSPEEGISLGSRAQQRMWSGRTIDLTA